MKNKSYLKKDINTIIKNTIIYVKQILDHKPKSQYLFLYNQN